LVRWRESERTLNECVRNRVISEGEECREAKRIAYKVGETVNVKGKWRREGRS